MREVPVYKKNKKTHLFHFQHKSRAVSFKIIIHTNSGEDLISNTEGGVFSRDKRTWKIIGQDHNAKPSHNNSKQHLYGFNMMLTYLSHDLTQRHLLEVGGFAAHVGPCYDDKVAALGNVGVV